MTTSLTESNFLHDNPDVYDQVNPEVCGAALAQFAFDLVKRHAPGTRVLDVGCGPGRELHHLTRYGLQVDGVDASEAMVARARAASPHSDVHLALMTEFDLPGTYDAVLCMGSTFLYNLTTDDILQSLDNFRRHLAPGGLLVMEMRSGAYYLTTEGQSMLNHVFDHEVDTPDGRLRYTSQFLVNAPLQLVDRYYTWAVPDREPVEEHLQHRLLFPAETAAYIAAAGLEMVDLFDEPAPALGRYTGPDHERSRSLTGRRMHVLARRSMGRGAP